MRSTMRIHGTQVRLRGPSPKGTVEAEAEPTSQLSPPHSEPPAVLDEPKAPAWTARGSAPGPRGCWAINKAGLPCSAPVRSDGDYCNSHSGIGVAADPKGHAARGIQASIESRRRRADLRLVIGSTRLDTPRGALRAAVLLEAERLARRAVGAATDPAQPPRDVVNNVLALVDAVDPKQTMAATIEGSFDPSTASLSQLLSFAEVHGIEPIGSISAAEAGSPQSAEG
jgi:hypothetical protein